MRSLADTRRWGERALRLASLALVAWMIRASLAPPARSVASRAARWDAAAASGGRGGGALHDSLRAWTLDPRAESLHVTAAAAPPRAARDWLAALRRAGAVVGWTAAGAVPLAVSGEAASDPAGGARVLVAAPRGAVVRVRDAAGLVDSVRVTGGAAEVRAPALEGSVSASVGAELARAGAPPALARRGVLVLGRAGWEGKFVIAALEERGWTVSARLAVSPEVSVSQGPLAFDTAHVAVVVALDSSAGAYAARIARFEREGGGLVLAGDAARARALAPLAAGAVGARIPAAALSPVGEQPRRALGFWPVTSLARDAVPLEVRGARVAAAARRVGAGRVVQVGYDDSWRWRLAGADGAPEAHRAWWSAVVGSAAYRALAPGAATDAAADPAPFAATVDALGDPSFPPLVGAAPPGGGGLRPWMLALLLSMLIIEWLSRRTRGAP